MLSIKTIRVLFHGPHYGIFTPPKKTPPRKSLDKKAFPERSFFQK